MRRRALLVAVLVLMVGHPADSHIAVSPPKVEKKSLYIEGLHHGKRKLVDEERLEILYNELHDPWRNPEYENLLHEEIERLGTRLTKMACGCN